MTDYTLYRLNAPAPDSLVVLLHGYGANGQDLLDLGRQWRTLLPNTSFIAPDAPAMCEINPGGFQWWSLADVLQSGITSALRETGAEAARADLTALIDRERQALGLPWQKVALVGFSQGCMLALHVGLRLPEAPAAILGYSGMLLAPQLLPQIKVRPPVMLVHGMMDAVVPFSALNIAETALKASGFDVESVTCPQLGHGIDQTGLQRGGQFLQQYL